MRVGSPGVQDPDHVVSTNNEGGSRLQRFPLWCTTVLCSDGQVCHVDNPLPAVGRQDELEKFLWRFALPTCLGTMSSRYATSQLKQSDDWDVSSQSIDGTETNDEQHSIPSMAPGVEGAIFRSEPIS